MKDSNIIQNYIMMYTLIVFIIVYKLLYQLVIRHSNTNQYNVWETYSYDNIIQCVCIIEVITITFNFIINLDLFQ